MIEIRQAAADNILSISAIGQVTDEDYKRTLIPAAEEKIRRHDRIRVLYHLGPQFERFEARAVVDDAVFGLRNFRHMERIAIVTDVDWCRSAVRMMRFLIPCPVKIFENARLAEAESWIAAKDVQT